MNDHVIQLPIDMIDPVTLKLVDVIDHVTLLQSDMIDPVTEVG